MEFNKIKFFFWWFESELEERDVEEGGEMRKYEYIFHRNCFFANSIKHSLIPLNLILSLTHLAHIKTEMELDVCDFRCICELITVTMLLCLWENRFSTIYPLTISCHFHFILTRTPSHTQLSLGLLCIAHTLKQWRNTLFAMLHTPWRN